VVSVCLVVTCDVCLTVTPSAAARAVMQDGGGGGADDAAHDVGTLLSELDATRAQLRDAVAANHELNLAVCVAVARHATD
jgi:hypothetical protein